MKKINEHLETLIENDAQIYNPETDKITRRTLDNTRKNVLTLRHLNTLKKVRATEAVGKVKRERLFGLMYASGAGDDSGSAF